MSTEKILAKRVNELHAELDRANETIRRMTPVVDAAVRLADEYKSSMAHWYVADEVMKAVEEYRK